MAVPVPVAYQADVNQAAASTGLGEAIVAAQIWTESRFDPNAVSPTGAQGIAQFEPQTWAAWGHGSPFNPADAFKAYAAYMSNLLTTEHGNIRNALAAYNAGPGNLSAGYGYADSILALAGSKGGVVGNVGPQDNQGGGLISQITQDIWGFLKLPLGALSGASDLASSILALAAPFVKIAEAIDWLLHPSHWIRIFAGLAGGVLVLGGAWQLTHAGGA